MEITKKHEYGHEIYNSRYKYGYDWMVYQPLARKVLEIMIISGCKDKKIIDIGCGIGWFTDMMFFNISKKIKGIDFSNIAINFHMKKQYPAIDCEVADAYTYNYSGYEVAVLMETLEHMEQDVFLFKKFDQNCRVFATVPYKDLRRDITHVREYDDKMIRERYGKVLDINVVTRLNDFYIIYGMRK